MILLTGRWEVLDRVYQGQWTHIGDPAYDNYLSRQMDLAIKILSSGGAKVLLLTTPCFAPQEQPDGSLWPFDDPARVIRYNQLLRQAAARHPGVASIGDLDAQFCPANTYSVVGGRGRRPHRRRHPHLRGRRSVRHRQVRVADRRARLVRTARPKPATPSPTSPSPPAR